MSSDNLVDKQAYSNLNELLHLESSILLSLLPKDRRGDNLLALINFVRTHNRYPSNQQIYNDVLHKIKTSNEILDPLRVFVSDKELVKTFIKSVVGDEFNVPTLKILKSMEEVNAYTFPENCFIKPTHSSTKFIHRKNDDSLDLKEIESWFSHNYYELSREVNYRYLKPKVIVEPSLSLNPNDYKIFCFNGKPRLIWVDYNRATNHQRNFFDLDWNEIPISLKYPRGQTLPPKPKNLALMIDLAAKLSRDFSLIRVDFYVIDDAIFVGELTNCSGSAMAKFDSFESECLASKIIFGSD
jgi:hypothetical protein